MIVYICVCIVISYNRSYQEVHITAIVDVDDDSDDSEADGVMS